jgi:DNA-binding beta-propeller fold protein YncE
VRFVARTNELWVTEPSSDQIEIFKLSADGTPTSDATVSVKNGPESLVIDEQRGRAYTHRWQRSTVAIDVTTHSIVGEWVNGCASSRGIAIDETRGWLFAACNEGTVAVLDLDHDGRILSTLARGSGFDVIGYSPKLGHLYLAGGECGCLVTLGVKANGSLRFLERQSAPESTHCAAADDVGHAWVCDPDGGRLLRFDDRQPSTL